MYEQHTASTVIHTHTGEPTGSGPVTVSTTTDKREEGYMPTATLSLNERDSGGYRVQAKMTADEWRKLGAACELQALILEGGVGR